MLTYVSISTFPSFNLSMFTKEDGTTINNEDRKKIKEENKLRFTQFCNF